MFVFIYILWSIGRTGWREASQRAGNVVLRDCESGPGEHICRVSCSTYVKWVAARVMGMLQRIHEESCWIVCERRSRKRLRRVSLLEKRLGKETYCLWDALKAPLCCTTVRVDHIFRAGRGTYVYVYVLQLTLCMCSWGQFSQSRSAHLEWVAAYM